MQSIRVFAVASLVYCLLSTLSTPAAFAHGTDPWVPCECDTAEYTLTIGAVGGTVVAVPEQDFYSKGQEVALVFMEDEDYVFNQWNITPSSHLASGSKESAVTIYITGNTNVLGIGQYTKGTVEISWNTQLGSVEGQTQSPHEVDMQLGVPLSLSATPNSGRHTIWRGAGSHVGALSGHQYSDSVTVLGSGGTLRLFVEFPEIPSEPPPSHTINMITDGGSAQMFTAVAPTVTWNAGRYPQSATTGPINSFAYSVSPNANQAVSVVRWTQGGEQRYTTATGASGVPGNTYTAHMVPQASIVVDVDGQGVVTSGQFTAAYHPKQYVWQSYSNPGALFSNAQPQTNSNEVTMTPEACPGWSFVGWEVDTGASIIQTTGNGGFSNPNNLTVYMNWWEGSGIRLANGEEVMNVKAVFEGECPECPEFEILTKAFIPQDNFSLGPEVQCLFSGVFNLYYKGDGRSFSYSSDEFRCKQRAVLMPASYCGGGGIMDYTETMGVTEVFAPNSIGQDGDLTQEALLDTILGDCDLKHCSEEGVWVDEDITVESVSPSLRRYRIWGSAKPGCMGLLGWIAPYFVAAIDYEYTLEFNVLDPYATSITSTSEHDCFPAHEIYIRILPSGSPVALNQFTPWSAPPLGLQYLLDLNPFSCGGSLYYTFNHN